MLYKKTLNGIALNSKIPPEHLRYVDLWKSDSYRTLQEYICYINPCSPVIYSRGNNWVIIIITHSYSSSLCILKCFPLIYCICLWQPYKGGREGIIILSLQMRNWEVKWLAQGQTDYSFIYCYLNDVVLTG